MNDWILSAFADEICDDLTGQMDELEKWDIRAIELRSANGKNVSAYTLEEAKDIRRQMADRGFVVSAVGSPIGKVDITAPFEPHLALFKHTLDVAHALDTPYIRMFSFFMPAGQPAARYRGEVLDRLGEMIRLAQDSGIVLLHENEKEIYGDVASRCWDLMTQLGCEHFAATYDFSNFVQCEEDNAVAWPLLKPYVRYFHLKDSLYSAGSRVRDLGHEVTGNAHRPLGEGDGKALSILQEADAAGFQGYLSIEPHLGDEYGLSGHEKFAAAAKAAQALVAQARA